ncbi:MAG TPA: hypothetical protein VFQ76_01765, partial [Longimicrobiaceae bacterium]|nr:hypothetical protein [Longimicrobiaceae bacterium]
NAVLVVIGKQWITGGDPFRRRRLGDAEDPVRLEIRSALQRSGVTVIPVLVDGATMPAQYELPDELRDLTRRNAVELRHATWGSDTRKLFQALEKVVDRPDRTASTRKQTRAGRRETAPGRKSQPPRESGTVAKERTAGTATGSATKRTGRPPGPRVRAEPSASPPVKKQPAKRPTLPDAEATPPKKKPPRTPAPKTEAGAGESKPRDGAVPTTRRKPGTEKRPGPEKAAKTGTARKKTTGAGAAATKKTPAKSPGTAKKRRKR